MTLIIHAPNIHQGGGRTLLQALLCALPNDLKCILILDERMDLPQGLGVNVQIRRVMPSVIQRFKAELWLKKNVAPESMVLCFGNLPPLFRLRGRTVVFLQNRYLVDDVRLNEFPLNTWARLKIERLWLSSRMSNANEFIVQTPTMKRLLETKTRGMLPLCILPFMAESNEYSRTRQKTRKKEIDNFNFLYIASGEPHKNHRGLIKAWQLLAEEGLFPSLRLTLDESHFQIICSNIEDVRKRFGLKITNAGLLSRVEAQALFQHADALIYPSTFESFGLPLIEARQAGLPVLASELDYVRDILDPEQSFDPESPISIARAVKRFLNVDEPPLHLLDARSVIDHVIGETK